MLFIFLIQLDVVYLFQILRDFKKLEKIKNNNFIEGV